MKLFLSSYKFGKQPGRLTDLVGKNKTVAVIINAHDYKSPEERNAKLDDELKELKSIGFEPFEYDLREYFNNELDKQLLESCGLVWVRGGNVFVLRLAMKLSGFDEYIKKAIKEEKFVYGGYSAGGCVLSPSLTYFDIVDNPNATKQAYGLDADYNGLNILDYYFQPHYKSDHPESLDIDKEIARIEAAEESYLPLRDGEAIIVTEDSQEKLT